MLRDISDQYVFIISKLFPDNSVSSIQMNASIIVQIVLMLHLTRRLPCLRAGLPSLLVATTCDFTQTEPSQGCPTQPPHCVRCQGSILLREWSLITGRGGLQNGRGGHVKFYPYEKGGREKF